MAGSVNRAFLIGRAGKDPTVRNTQAGAKIVNRPSKDQLEWWSMVSGQSSVPPMGAFVCTAVLANVLSAVRVPPDDYGDYSEGRFAWHLTDIEPIDPAIPARGAQGFWKWDPDA